MTATLAPEGGARKAPPPPPQDKLPRTLPRWAWGLGVIVLWILVWSLSKGIHTLQIPVREHTDVQQNLTDFRDSVLASRDSNWFLQFAYSVGERFTELVNWAQRMLSIPDLPRPVPQVGWLGVTAIAAWVGLALAGWRIMLLVAGSFLAFGAFGFWSDSVDLLIVTMISVGIAVLIGMPLAIWLGTSRRPWVVALLNTLLDVFQTMPTFVYLLPIVLFVGIGGSAAVVCTTIYALPPIIRVAGYGIRNVSATTIEATESAGQTTWQRLLKVQLPMARPTIVVGLNQTIMAALSMATLASFVDGPGLGKPVLAALQARDVGGGFVPGMLIVVMAVMLDRTMTAASQASEKAARGGVDLRLRRIVLAVTGVLALVAVYASRTYKSLAEFPDMTTGTGDRTWGLWLAIKVDELNDWFIGVFGGATEWFKDAISFSLLNPLQSLIAESPWFVAGGAILLLAFVFGGLRAVVPTAICLGGLLYFGLWHNAMITLAMTLVGTLLVMALAVVFGVWMARRSTVDLIVRPLLDAGQTIPPFVYLIPMLALFGPSRFTAILAGVVYAAPVAIKLVADGIKGVSPSTVEAARSTGATTWQEIVGVQLPMARGSLVLAANQGLLYVLSMAVIGGMVGAGALGYDVVLGFSRSEEWGKGAAAGISIVLLGIMIDRICRAAAIVDRSEAASRPKYRKIRAERSERAAAK